MTCGSAPEAAPGAADGRVLVTRPEPDASVFAGLCAANGLSPIMAPLMEIDIRPAAVDLDGIGALAFTSANGARAFAANSAVRRLTVFAVGPATAEAARKEGFADIRVAGGDVDALARLIDAARAEFDGAVLHAAGSERAGDLIAALDAVGLAARRAVVYRARAVAALPAAARDALAALDGSGPGLWAAFFSPRTAALFVDLVRAAGLSSRLAQARAACLSNAVADEIGADRARAEGARPGGAVWKSIEVAADRSMEGMIALMRV